jgi:hypothetical protein
MIRGAGTANLACPLGERTDKLLAMRPRHEPNRRLLGHLANEREHMFTSPTEPGVHATNWRAERALRPNQTSRPPEQPMSHHTPAHNVIVQIKIKLLGDTKPPVWRRVQLRAEWWASASG